KIIPNSDYLKEIRNIVFSNHKNKDYDNSEVIDLFEAKFNKIEMIDISYKVKLNKEELNKLLDMTPLTWYLSDVEIEGIIKKKLSEITMSFKVLVCGFKTSLKRVSRLEKQQSDLLSLIDLFYSLHFTNYLLIIMTKCT